MSPIKFLPSKKKASHLPGFIAESILGVAGQIEFPKGYLPRVYQLIRDAGGVCIAGRSPSWIWPGRKPHVGI